MKSEKLNKALNGTFGISDLSEILSASADLPREIQNSITKLLEKPSLDPDHKERTYEFSFGSEPLDHDSIKIFKNHGQMMSANTSFEVIGEFLLDFLDRNPGKYKEKDILHYSTYLIPKRHQNDWIRNVTAGKTLTQLLKQFTTIYPGVLNKDQTWSKLKECIMDKEKEPIDNINCIFQLYTSDTNNMDQYLFRNAIIEFLQKLLPNGDSIVRDVQKIFSFEEIIKYLNSAWIRDILKEAGSSRKKGTIKIRELIGNNATAVMDPASDPDPSSLVAARSNGKKVHFPKNYYQISEVKKIQHEQAKYCDSLCYFCRDSNSANKEHSNSNCQYQLVQCPLHRYNEHTLGSCYVHTGKLDFINHNRKALVERYKQQNLNGNPDQSDSG